MEKALNVKDWHSIDEQLAFLRGVIVPSNDVFLAVEENSDRVVGMMAVDGTELNQLYIHVDHQRKGLGKRLIELAKKMSPGRLLLYTFEVNTGARQFYEKLGFKIIARGFEKEWQLSDIRYEWVSGAAS